MSALRDLTGQRFGRLTVLYRAENHADGHARWHCICDCGNEADVTGHDLVRGSTTSCGCYQIESTSQRRRLNLIGRQFGKLMVIALFGMDKRHNCIWTCLCSCGNPREVHVSNGRLMSGGTISCGCAIKESLIRRNTTHGLSNTKEYANSRGRLRREKKKRLDFRWTLEMEFAIRDFFPSCIWCGGDDRLSTDHVYPLEKGYGLEPGNAVILCIHCNSSKGDKMPNELSANKRKLLLDAAESFRAQWMD